MTPGSLSRRTQPVMHALKLGVAFVLAAALAGCSMPFVNVASPNALTVTGQGEPGADPVRLAGDFDAAYYSYQDENSVTFVLLDGPEANPDQAAVLRLFWRPRAGRTPLESTATNVTIQYLVFADRGGNPDDAEVGVYAGAGFLMPGQKPGPAKLSAEVWDANLQLDTRSDQFRDLLGLATLTGSFTATRDEAKVNDLLNTLTRQVSARLGFPRLVRTDAPTPALPLAAEPM